MAKDERRLNLYLSQNKCIDDTIYQYLEGVANKQDKIKMILYSYITGQGFTPNEIVPKNTQEIKESNTNTTPKSERSVTKGERKKHTKVTKKEQNSVESVTKNPRKEPVKETEFALNGASETEQQVAKTNIEEKKAKLLSGMSYFNKK